MAKKKIIILVFQVTFDLKSVYVQLNSILKLPMIWVEAGSASCVCVKCAGT